jgi:hypothetical protein
MFACTIGSSLPRKNVRSILHSSKPPLLTKTLYMFFRIIQLYSSLLPALRLPPESSLSFLTTLNPWLASQPTSSVRSDRCSTIHLYNLFDPLLVHILHLLTILQLCSRTSLSHIFFHIKWTASYSMFRSISKLPRTQNNKVANGIVFTSRAGFNPTLKDSARSGLVDTKYLPTLG